MQKYIVAMAVILGSQLFSNPLQDSNELSIDDLQKKCSSLEEREQAIRFTSSFTCKMTKTFWSKSGEKSYVLAKDSDTRIRAHIKDGKHQTEWWTVPGEGEEINARCDIVEQWSTTAELTKTFHSCAELEAIVQLGQEQYCKQELEKVWEECDDERDSSVSAKGFDCPAKGIGRCVYELTGVTKSCEPDGETVPLPVCKDKAIQSHSSSSSHSSLSSDDDSDLAEQIDTGNQGSCVMDLPSEQVSSHEMGGELEVIVVNRGIQSLGGWSIFHRSHAVILVASAVQPGGLLDQLGLRQGDIVSRVNSKRTRKLSEFVDQVYRAKVKGLARIEFSNVDQADFKKSSAWSRRRIENF